MGPDWRFSEMFICVLCLKFAVCRELILRTFLCDGTSKPLLTSKPSLTIAIKISKTIEKPLKPMVGPSKNIQWWWSNDIKTIKKPLKSIVAWNKTLTIPLLWKIDHRCGLISTIFFWEIKGFKLEEDPLYSWPSEKTRVLNEFFRKSLVCLVKFEIKAMRRCFWINFVGSTFIWYHYVWGFLEIPPIARE